MSRPRSRYPRHVAAAPDVDVAMRIAVARLVREAAAQSNWAAHHPLDLRNAAATEPRLARAAT